VQRARAGGAPSSSTVRVSKRYAVAHRNKRGGQPSGADRSDDVDEQTGGQDVDDHAGSEAPHPPRLRVPCDRVSAEDFVNDALVAAIQRSCGQASSRPIGKQRSPVTAHVVGDAKSRSRAIVLRSGVGKRDVAILWVSCRDGLLCSCLQGTQNALFLSASSRSTSCAHTSAMAKALACSGVDISTFRSRMRLRVDASNFAVAQHFSSSVLWSVLYRSVFSVVTVSGSNVASCVAPGCRRFRGRCGHVRTLRDVIGPGGFNDERFGSSAAAVKARLEGRVKLASVPARPRVVNNEEEDEGIEKEPTDTIRGPRDAEPTKVASRRLRNMLPCSGELKQGEVWTRTADWRSLYGGRAAGVADGKKDDLSVLGSVWSAAIKRGFVRDASVPLIEKFCGSCGQRLQSRQKVEKEPGLLTTHHPTAAPLKVRDCRQCRLLLFLLPIPFFSLFGAWLPLVFVVSLLMEGGFADGDPVYAQPVQSLLVRVYGSQVWVCRWTCDAESCGRVVEYDGQADGLFSMRRRNKNRRWLLYTRGLLDKLISFIIAGRTTYTAATRHLSADVLSFTLRRQDVVKVGTAYLKALHIPPETAQCPKCGRNPAFIVIDAQSLGCTDHADTKPFRPTEDCPVLDIPASKLYILESTPLREAISKVLRTSTSLTAAQEVLLRAWAGTMLTPMRRLSASVAAARLFFRFFPLGTSEPRAATKRGGGLSSAASNASPRTQAPTDERPTKRSRVASVNSSAENALRSDGDGGVVLGGKGPVAKKPTETWRDRTGVCRPAFERYPRDDDGVWICVRPFLQSLLTETVPGMFTSFNERAIKLISNTMCIKGRGAWRVLTEALDGVGFVSSFVGLFAEDMDEDKGMRVAVGTLLRWAVDIEKFVDEAFAKVASSKTTLARGWINGAYCERWKGRPTSADYKRWRTELKDLDELDEDDPLVSFEYFASLPRVRPGIRDSETAKRRVQYRGKDRHVADLEGEGDACNKAFAIRSGLTQGVFNVVCPHVITLGFRVLFNAESVGEALSIVLERFPRLPKAIFYDVACKLDKNAMRRVRVIIRDHHVRCVLDRPHSITHGCSPTYMPDEFLGTTAGVATQAAEVSHAIAVVNRTSLAYMSPATYMVHKMAQVAFMNLRKLYRLHSDTAAGENDHVALAPFFNDKVAQECQRAGTCSCGSTDDAVANDASGSGVVDAAADALSDAGGLGARAQNGAAAVAGEGVDARRDHEVPTAYVEEGGHEGDAPRAAEVVVIDGVDDDLSAGDDEAVADTAASAVDAAIHPDLLVKHANWVVGRVFYAPMDTAPVSQTQKELVRQLVNAPLAAAVRPRNKARIVLSGADFLRLVGEAWLRGEVMNSVVALINDRDDRARSSRALVGDAMVGASPAPPMPRTRVFNTYFVSRLAPRRLHYNYDAVRRWGIKAGLDQGLLNLSHFIESEYTPLALTCTQI